MWKKLTDIIKGKITDSDKMRYDQVVLKMNIARSCTQAVVETKCEALTWRSS